MSARKEKQSAENYPKRKGKGAQSIKNWSKYMDTRKVANKKSNKTRNKKENNKFILRVQNPSKSFVDECTQVAEEHELGSKEIILIGVKHSEQYYVLGIAKDYPEDLSKMFVCSEYGIKNMENDSLWVKELKIPNKQNPSKFRTLVYKDTLQEYLRTMDIPETSENQEKETETETSETASAEADAIKDFNTESAE